MVTGVLPTSCDKWCRTVICKDPDIHPETSLWPTGCNKRYEVSFHTIENMDLLLENMSPGTSKDLGPGRFIVNHCANTGNLHATPDTVHLDRCAVPEH